MVQRKILRLENEGSPSNAGRKAIHDMNAGRRAPVPTQDRQKSGDASPKPSTASGVGS